MAYDQEQHPVAQRYMIRPLRFAHAGGYDALGAEILAGMSHQAAYLGQSDDAVDMARSAARCARRAGQPVLLAEAHSHALPGNPRSAVASLINTDDPGDAAALLAACRRHVADHRRVLIQRHTVSWFDDATPSESSRPGMTVRLRDLSRPARGLLRATVEYEVGDSLWTHTFTARRVDDAELTRLLGDAALRLERFLTDDGAWLSAIPA